MHKTDFERHTSHDGTLGAQSGFISYMVAIIFITWMSGMAVAHAVL